ncbi:hypothetical protein [Sporosarcina sp. UB5]|uniref:hypothetical protein n=1 Tax=Sporosarcina sp. UB5 TaxID=3047463 RepID=UPI003D7A4069
MKFNWKIICTGFVAAILLTACGTDNAEQQDGTNEEQIVDETNGSSTGGASTDSESASGADSDNGEQSTGDATEAVLTESDEQAFAMEVLPGFTLTSEEPGRDVLYANDEPRAFMRIETQPTEDGTYEYLLENVQDVLKAASNGEAPEQLMNVFTEASQKGIEKAKAFKVNTETGPVTGVVFEKNGMVVRLTLFDNLDEKYKDDFLNMGQTIQ